MNHTQSADVHYHSTFRICYHEETGGYLTSGIVALDREGNTVTAIADVSCDFEWVEELVERLNAGGAHPQQLADIVMDELAR